MKLWSFLSLILMFLASLPLQAFTSVSAVRSTNQPRLTGALIMQDIEYETNNEFSIDGDILVFGYKAPVNRKFALGAGLGLLIDGDLGDTQTIGDGSGFRFFLDGDFEIHRFDGNQVVGTFALIHDRFKFDEGTKIEFMVTEIKLGGLILHRLQNISFYGGLELVLYSDGNIKTNFGKIDIDRRDRLNFHLGSAFAIAPAIDLRADLFLLGEQTLLFGADFRI